MKDTILTAARKSIAAERDKLERSLQRAKQQLADAKSALEAERARLTWTLIYQHEHGGAALQDTSLTRLHGLQTLVELTPTVAAHCKAQLAEFERKTPPANVLFQCARDLAVLVERAQTGSATGLDLAHARKLADGLHWGAELEAILTLPAQIAVDEAQIAVDEQEPASAGVS